MYLIGPLDVLSGGHASAVLPAELTRSLHNRWRAACAAYPPAAVFADGAAELVARTDPIV